MKLDEDKKIIFRHTAIVSDYEVGNEKIRSAGIISFENLCHDLVSNEND